MNPELSFAATASLPRERANAKARRNVSSDVVTARTTSTSCISGTGLKKCRPTKRSARLVAAAMAAMVRLDVLEAKIVCGGQMASSSCHSAFLSSRSSVIASTTMSQPFRSVVAVVKVSRLSAASRSAAASFPFSTNFPSDFSIPPRARSQICCDTSRTIVSRPAVAATCAMPLPIRPHPSTPTRRISVIPLPAVALGRSTAGRRPRVEKRAPQFLGDPHEGARLGAGEGMVGADFPALEPVEHLLEPHLNALVLRAVTPGHEQGGGPEQRRLGKENRGDDGERDRGGERRDRDRQGDECRSAAQPCLALVPDAGYELNVAEPRLELGRLSRHLGGARQRVALATRAQGPLDRGERADLGLPRRAIPVAALQLEQLLLLHPPGESALHGRLLARDDARGGEPGRSRQPAPQAGLLRHIGARALLEQGLVEVAGRDADVLAQREDLGLGQPVADVLGARLELGGAADDALERLTADQLARHR